MIVLSQMSLHISHWNKKIVHGIQRQISLTLVIDFFHLVFASRWNWNLSHDVLSSIISRGGSLRSRFGLCKRGERNMSKEAFKGEWNIRKTCERKQAETCAIEQEIAEILFKQTCFLLQHSPGINCDFSLNINLGAASLANASLLWYEMEKERVYYIN